MTMGAFLLCGQFYKEEKIMKELENIKYVIFGFNDQETGNKLRLFFKKHTDKDVDFNNIKHYENGFKLLLFTVPLDTFNTVGITGACCAPNSVKRINGSIDSFISWYEKEYLPSIAKVRRGPMITVVLSNGLTVRIPLKNARETVRQMEENIKYNKKKKK